MLGKVLRIVGIVLLAITAVFTLTGGIGTTCVALDATQYEGMEAISDYQWLYILYVIAGIVIGVMGLRATVALIRAKTYAYRAALVALVAGLIVGGIHIATSRALRGKSMPVDFVVYATFITLIVFLIFRIPSIWHQFNRSNDDNTSGMGAGVAMIVSGVLILTVQYWAGPTHMIDNINYADVWHSVLAIFGWGISLGGLAILGNVVLGKPMPQKQLAEA
ncbi:MAG: hypothetical protein GY943_07655 [Chloroflexi bacterium]|nr:hypothetical protein [Chloroflexota bacterium]